jgi:hypothetical protein
MTFHDYDRYPPRHRITGKVKMNYSTFAEVLASDQDGVIVDVGSVYSRLMELPDLRARRGRRYELALLLLVVVLAKLAGQDKPEGIAEWVKLRAAFFEEVFQLQRPLTPHAMTYRRVLANSALAAALDTLTREYLLSWPQAGHSVQIALDGKTLRGTIAAEAVRALHLSYRPLNTPPLAAGMKAGLFPLPGEGKLKKGWASCMLVRSAHEPTRPQRA